MKKVLFLGCSNSDISINNDLAERICSSGSFELLLLNKYKDIPLFSKDILQKEGMPRDVQKLFDFFKDYQVLVFFAPEHNGYFSSFFKNILDWLSILNKVFLDGKDVFLCSVSPTKREARNIEFFARRTFEIFKCKSFAFFNFNDYTKDSDRENKIKKELLASIEKI